MKQILIKSFQIFFLGLVTLSFTGCLKNDDNLTDGVRTGGFVKVTGNIPYKLGFTPILNLPINVPFGAPIKEIKIYKQYFHNADTTESNKVLQTTMNIAGANATAALSNKLSLTWAELIKDIVLDGYTIPADELTSDIGDYFVFSFVTVMQSDDVEITNLATTTVAIANFFAGSYKSERKYFHPAYGPYPVPYTDVTSNMDLVAVDANTCKVFFGAWEDNFVFINIDAANVINITFDRTAFVGDPIDAAKVCSYDPVSGVIKIYYYYNGSAGADPLNPVSRIFWQTFTPNN